LTGEVDRNSLKILYPTTQGKFRINYYEFNSILLMLMKKL